MNQVAIVILNYNGKAYLEQFLPSLVRFSKPYQVYVADNASTDGSINYLKKHHQEVKLIVLQENYGYAGGYNEALKQLEEEYFILINSDVEVTKNWVEPLIATLSSDIEIVACQPKIKAYHQKTHFEYAGGAGGYIDWLGYPFCRGRIFDTLEKDTGQYDKPYHIFWASGACFAIKKKYFHHLGGFDAGFFAHMEEIDLCWRIQNAEKKIIYNPDSVVFHVGGGTLASTSPKKTYLNFRNGLLLLVKNIPTIELIYKLPFRSLLDGLAILKFIVDRKPAHALAVIKAHFHALPRTFNYLRKKRKRLRKISKKLIFSKLIVFQYFIKGKSKFSDLKF